jgi:hypothetical protein
MKPHRAIVACAAAVAVVGTAPFAISVRARQSENPAAVRQSEPPASTCDLPVLKVYRYKMAGRVRPLLFWIGRDDVGMGEIVWRGAEGGVAYELLIGTDAVKAPRAINRWGYILEENRPSGTRVLGVMTTSDEATIRDVTAKADEKQRTGRFKGIDAHIAAGICRSATETIETEREFGIRDKEEIVGRIQRRLRDATPREVAVPDGVRPGFLIAVAELVDDTIAARKGGDQALRRLKGRKLSYVYSRRLYDLELTGVELLRPGAATPSRPGHVHADFQTTNRETGNRSTFELEFATDGPLAGVPTLIRHQPRWWLQAVLTLEEGPAPPNGSAAGPIAKR